MSLTIARGCVVTPEGVLPEHDVVFEGDRIVEVRPCSSRPRGADVIDVPGSLVLPGLVDIHLHGAHGHTFNDSDETIWRSILSFHLAAGTTTALATLMTDTVDRLGAALAVARDLLGSEGCPASLAGVHLEGPFLDELQCGAQPRHLLLAPTDPAWQVLSGFLDVVRILTLAPELPGIDVVIDTCQKSGVVVSAGHSSADEGDLAAAQAKGVRHLAHLWSGQSALWRDGPWRRPGLLEASLASDGLTAELIADGRHLPTALVRIAFRCLGPERLCLVSDASAGTGLPPGSTFEMGAARGIVVDGVAVTPDGSSFCGSTSALLDVLRSTVTDAGIPLVDAVRMAATTPAEVIGLGDRCGALLTGLVADAVVVSPDLAPVAVVQRGVAVAGRTPSGA